jgi:ATP citrate (pro-S)-lyase
MIVVLGELGGCDEYLLVEALQQGRVQKPVVAWVSGTCACLFKSEVQFGHAVSSLLLLALPFLIGN